MSNCMANRLHVDWVVTWCERWAETWKQIASNKLLLIICVELEQTIRYMCSMAARCVRPTWNTKYTCGRVFTHRNLGSCWNSMLPTELLDYWHWVVAADDIRSICVNNNSFNFHWRWMHAFHQLRSPKRKSNSLDFVSLPAQIHSNWFVVSRSAQFPFSTILNTW